MNVLCSRTNNILSNVFYIQALQVIIYIVNLNQFEIDWRILYLTQLNVIFLEVIYIIQKRM